ncbi:MAG: porin [Bacteroidetes bacterium]|nr:porin [Bacteroidota bacterium]MBL0256449.1 porin [Bacteroidota bacterium]
MKKQLFAIALFTTTIASAQIDTSKSTVNFSGYVEAYYTYDFNSPDNHNRPGFFYSHPRHNEFNLNLGFVKAAYSTDKVRANLAIGAGSYMNSNYSAEPGVLKNIYEANAGMKLSKNKNLWLDAGIFASHIGFESAVSKDCWGLTRSILADNSPYYESGAKLTYISNNSKWLLSALILNGWQHIQRPDGNNSPAFGTQITFTPNSNITLNYSTFIGNDKPDTAKQMRYFHNLYGVFHVSDKFHITAGFDYGMEQKSEASSDYNAWYSPVILVKVNMNDQWSVTARGEYYMDEKGVIIATGTTNGFQTTGYSLNLDCKLRENAVWRIEARTLNSKDKIFSKENGVVNTNTFVTTSLAISF